MLGSGGSNACPCSVLAQNFMSTSTLFTWPSPNWYQVVVDLCNKDSNYSARAGIATSFLKKKKYNGGHVVHLSLILCHSTATSEPGAPPVANTNRDCNSQLPGTRPCRCAADALHPAAYNSSSLLYVPLDALIVKRNALSRSNVRSTLFLSFAGAGEVCSLRLSK